MTHDRATSTTAETAIEMLCVDEIECEPGRRQVNADAVERLAETMRSIGLKTPITVRHLQGRWVLVAGGHRLAAAKKLGWLTIACYSAASMTDDEARLWEISENLHRAELTALERDNLVADWIRITDARDISSQVATKLNGRPKGGINAAARALGIGKDATHRAAKVAGLSPEAKEAAREVGLDDNRSALLKAARAAPDKQAEAIHDIAARKEGDRAARLTDVFESADARHRDQPIMTAPRPYVRSNPPESIYVDLPYENSFDEAERRAKAWEEADRAAWDKAQQKPCAVAPRSTTTPDLPDQKYGAIYVNLDGIAEIKSLDLPSIAADDAIIFLWSSANIVPQALEVMKAWGFAYKSEVIWAKNKAGAGCWFRSAHETLLVGMRGNIPAPAPGTRFESVIHAPVGAYSVKPDIFRAIIEKYYPTLPKIELNARGDARDGRAAWGLEEPITAADDPFGLAERVVAI